MTVTKQQQQQQQPQQLPHLTSPTPFLTECGMETTLVYKDKLHLPCFSSLPLLGDPTTKALISSYYKAYISIATAHHTGIILDTRTWRASIPWAKTLGYTEAQILRLNRDAVQMLQDLRSELSASATATAATTKASPTSLPPTIIISGALGPLQDAYEDSSSAISLADARAGYSDQIRTLVDAGVDLLSLMTVTNLNEAVAVVQLAKEMGVPVVVSFSIESDGYLLGGQSLERAIQTVDEKTDGYALYFGVNCAHPLRIAGALAGVSEEGKRRIGFFRGNASLKSHDELDNSETLDRGDLPTYIRGYERVMEALEGVNVKVKALGGCCGTDEEHLAAIAERFLKGSSVCL